MNSTDRFPRMHVSLYVNNLQESLAFYSSFFGTPPTKVKDNYAKYVLTSPSLIISFIENPERVQANFGHLGFQVESEEILQKQLNKAQDLGLVTKEEIGTACCYAVQDKFWCTDPNGIQWEVYYFHEDAEFNDPHYALSDTEACCTPEMEESKTTKISQSKPKVQLSNACMPGSGCC